MTSLATRLLRIEKRLTTPRDTTALVYSDPLSFARRSLSFTPDPWQAQVLQWQGKRLLLNCCRQAGKSVTAAILALHRACYCPGSLILLVSPSLRQSSELFRKVTDFLALLPVRPQLTEDNKLSLQLANRARVVSLPSSEATIRGFSGASLIVEDEASRVSDDLYLALRPMLAVSGGQLILMSTPFGKRGHFFDAWEHGGGSWQRIKITASECPRISQAFLAEEKAIMPTNWFRSEYEGEFTETLNQVFAYDDVMVALDPTVLPLFGEEVPTVVDPSSDLRHLADIIDPRVSVLSLDEPDTGK